MIAVEEIRDEDGLTALEPEWARLWNVCPYATPFQSPEWILPWWRVFHPGRLAVLALRGEGRLVGLAPFYIADDRILRFIGTGISDYLDILIAPEIADRGAGLILDALARSQSGWESCDLLELRPESPLIAMGAAALPAEKSVCSVCVVAPLPAAPGHGLRRNVQRYRRQFGETGELSFETGAGGHGREHLDALFRLHRARWSARQESGVLADRALREFHAAVAEGFEARGWLRTFGLRFEGSLVAVMYTFAARGRAYCYLSGFSPEYERYSPGVLLLRFALDEFARAGLAEADFLRGQEPYKYVWGGQDRPNYRLRFTRP